MSVNLPKARTTNLIRRELESEIIFYDLENLEAGSLSTIATEVLNLCNGRRTAAKIKAEIGDEKISEQGVYYVLEQLNKAKLLEPGYLTPKLAFNGTSRRAVLAALAIGTVPLVVGVPVPAAAQAGSMVGACDCCNPSVPNQCPSGYACLPYIVNFPPGTRFRCRTSIFQFCTAQQCPPIS